MIINNKIVLVFDIEIFPNCFHCVVKDTESKKKLRLEISQRRNDINKILRLFYRFPKVSWNDNYNTSKQLGGKYLFCGYNNIHYDNPIINYIITNYNEFERLYWSELCYKLFQLSQEIVNTTGEGFKSWHKWKYIIYYDTLDLLTMLYSTKLRVGLKEMQVTMQYRNVQEYEGDFTEPLPLEDFEEMIHYNENDVDSTEELLYRCIDDINLRLAIEKEYGVKVLNKDGVNIGMKIITKKYLDKTGLTWNQIKDLRSPCDEINLNEIILPIVKFENKQLQDILVELKQQTVSPGRKGYEKHFLFDGLEYTIGVGGI